MVSSPLRLNDLGKDTLGGVRERRALGCLMLGNNWRTRASPYDRSLGFRCRFR